MVTHAGLPIFDAMLLGLGPDAHVASLFPNRAQVAATDSWVLPVENSPKPPPERITMSLPVINRCAWQHCHLIYPSSSMDDKSIYYLVFYARGNPSSICVTMKTGIVFCRILKESQQQSRNACKLELCAMSRHLTRFLAWAHPVLLIIHFMVAGLGLLKACLAAWS